MSPMLVLKRLETSVEINRVSPWNVWFKNIHTGQNLAHLAKEPRCIFGCFPRLARCTVSNEYTE